VSLDPRGALWPTPATRPPPRDLASREQAILLFAGDAARERAVELGYITDDCTDRDWEKIVQLGPGRFDHIMRLRGFGQRGG
jgi:hypothetical protein